MKERFHAKNPRSMWCRFHVQTSGCTLTAQQPLNNIVRVAIQALAAVLGGCQSLHTNSYDEALCLPSWQAVTIALRTQQIIAYETGVTDTVDPLGGSYYVEWLTREMEERAMEYIQKIDDMGGIIPAIEKGFIVREISDAAYRYQREIEEKKRIIVGVNEFVMEEEPVKIELFRVDPEVEKKQIERVNEIRRTRNNKKVKELLEELRRAAEKNENVMPYVLKAVKAYATLGEIIGTLKEVYGEYKPEVII
jgi:methylmalonyl-CoA mutase N-terminal domain/subunit